MQVCSEMRLQQQRRIDELIARNSELGEKLHEANEHRLAAEARLLDVERQLSSRSAKAAAANLNDKRIMTTTKAL